MAKKDISQKPMKKLSIHNFAMDFAGHSFPFFWIGSGQPFGPLGYGGG